MFIVLSCSSNLTKMSNSTLEAEGYKVYKIKSVENYYLIYAKKNDSLYKIISKKESIANCNEIKKNGIYDFKLQAILKNRFKNTKFPKPMNDLDITCFTFEGGIKICREEGMDELYYADNIKGSCFLKK